MLFSHKHKFVYMAPPKTGTTTITRVLNQSFDAQLWDFTETCLVRTTKDTNIQGKEWKWPRHIIHLPEEIKDYFVFATMKPIQTCNVTILQSLYAYKDRTIYEKVSWIFST